MFKSRPIGYNGLPQVTRQRTGEFLHKLRDSEGQELGSAGKNKDEWEMGVGIDIAVILNRGEGVNGKL